MQITDPDTLCRVLTEQLLPHRAGIIPTRSPDGQELLLGEYRVATLDALDWTRHLRSADPEACWSPERGRWTLE